MTGLVKQKKVVILGSEKREIWEAKQPGSEARELSELVLLPVKSRRMSFQMVEKKTRRRTSTEKLVVVSCE